MNDKSLTPTAALLLLAVFAACSVMTLLDGAQVYSGIQERDAGVLDIRTEEAYVTARIRSCDSAGAIEVLGADMSPAAEGPILAMHEDYGGRDFVTLLYVLDGQLRELFMPADAGLDLSDGDPVLGSDGLSFGWTSDGLLRVRAHGREYGIALRSGMEGGG